MKLSQSAFDAFVRVLEDEAPTGQVRKKGSTLVLSFAGYGMQCIFIIIGFAVTLFSMNSFQLFSQRLLLCNSKITIL